MDQENISRRTVLKAAAPLLAASAWAQSAASKSAVYAYLGSFTTQLRNGRGDGIHTYRVDPETGVWTHVQHLGDLMNPSFLVTSRDQRFIYSSHGDGEYVSSFSVDRSTGSLTPLNKGATGGTNGAHLAVDPTGKFIVVANYATGTVAVLPVRPEGSVGDHIQVMDLKGEPGPHKTEQTTSHPHDIVFDPTGRFVATPDKGLDRIFLFHFDPASGKLSPTEQGSVATRAGSGPRHFAFHPKISFGWAINELNSTMTTYSWDGQRGALQPIQVLPSTPSEYTGNNTGAEVVVSANGRFVYCSNRGHDSVAVYSIDQQSGLLKPVAWTPTQGKSPRYIGFDPSQRFLYATNEQGDNVVTFRVDASTGKLTPSGQIVRAGSPVAIAFVSETRKG